MLRQRFKTGHGFRDPEALAGMVDDVDGPADGGGDPFLKPSNSRLNRHVNLGGL
jgi:hypothetical protein